MTIKKLLKKLILVLNFHGLNEQEKLNKMSTIEKAHANHPSVVPGLDPPAATVETMITNAQNLLDQRNDMLQKLKSITTQFHQIDEALTDIFVSSWVKQTQVAIAGDATLAKLFPYGIRGESAKDKMPEGSRPFIIRIDIRIDGPHILHTINNLTGKTKLPADILCIDVYAQTGGVKPNGLAQLKANGGSYLGQATSGKFENTPSPTDKGQIIHYIVVYVDKKNKKIVAESWVASAIVN